MPVGFESSTDAMLVYVVAACFGFIGSRVTTTIAMRFINAR